MKVKITFLEKALGTLRSDPIIYANHLFKEGADEETLNEELDAVKLPEGEKDKGITIFPRLEDGTPFIYDYQIKGFFKDACSMLNKLNEKGEDGKKKVVNESGKLTAFKKIIDGLIFVEPRKIPINLNGGEMGFLERPLRASTPQGERITVVCSETVPAGSSFEIEITCLDKKHEKAVEEWLTYGRMRGLLQWRNGGHGILTYTRLD